MKKREFIFDDWVVDAELWVKKIIECQGPIYLYVPNLKKNRNESKLCVINVEKNFSLIFERNFEILAKNHVRINITFAIS